MPPPFEERWNGHLMLTLSVCPSVSIHIWDGVSHLRLFFRQGHPCPLGTFLFCPRWLGSSWQRDRRDLLAIDPVTLMIDTPEGGPLMWMLPLYLHVNQKSDDDQMMWRCAGTVIGCSCVQCYMQIDDAMYSLTLLVILFLTHEHTT